VRAQGGITLGLEQGELDADFCRLGKKSVQEHAAQFMGLNLACKYRSPIDGHVQEAA
jgi:hypothetical protein